jgi:hypothetical protein
MKVLKIIGIVAAVLVAGYYAFADFVEVSFTGCHLWEKH